MSAEREGEHVAEFWYINLPAGQRLRGETPADAINRELAELVARGWEPISITRDNLLTVGFLLRKGGA